MTAVQIIRDLQSRGVELRAEGNRLRFRPKEALTPDTVEVLRRHKSEIIAALTVPTVRARVRGPGGTTETTSPEVCFHCHGNRVCRCTLCVASAVGLRWKPGHCRACEGSGLLTWPEGLQ